MTNRFIADMRRLGGGARCRTAAATAAMVAGLLAVALPPAAAAPPRLRISGPRGASLDIERTPSGASRALFLGLRMKNLGGDLTLKAARTHGRVRITQDLDGRSHPVTTVTATRRRPYTLREGLPDALQLTVSRKGRVVLQKSISWCPTAGKVELETPKSCGDALSTHVTWQLTHGQAISLSGTFAQVPDGLPNGVYRGVLRLDPAKRIRQAAPAVWHGTVKVGRPSVRYGSGSRNLLEDHDPPAGINDQPADTANLAGARLPDLLPLAPEHVQVVHDHDVDAVAFSGTIADKGAALVVMGAHQPGDPPDTLTATQVLQGASGPVLHPAGHLFYDRDDGHDHWHFNGLAHYRLTRAGNDTTLLESKKIGFCFADTSPFDLSVPGAPVQPIQPALHGTSCEHNNRQATSVRMELSAGWLDEYAAGLPGQLFPITTLPNGRYTIVVEVNLRRLLAESSTANDVATRTFTLAGRRGHRTVRVGPEDGVFTDADY